MNLAIEISGLSKQYASVRALDAVSLPVERGTVTALLGPNGAGKTTLMEIVMGMRRATEGVVRVLGCDPWQESDEGWRRNAGYLPQEVVPIEYLTGSEYMELVNELYLTDAKDIEHRLASALEFFDLTEAKTKRVGTYSTGMKKKVVLCSLYVARPDLMILDEPFEGLDPHAIRRLQSWISELARDGTTFLLSSHTIPFVAKVATHVAVIDHGRILHHAPITAPDALEDLYFSFVRRSDAA